jgi:hypothetical protein
LRPGGNFVDIELEVNDLVLPATISELRVIATGNHIEHDGTGAEVERNAVAHPQSVVTINAER